jgi:Icc-related predicted phosphoesterase
VARFRRGRRQGTRLFYAADLHGSELTWRKFVAAAQFYDVDALILGGDLMGKALVPIVERGGEYVGRLWGQEQVFDRSGLAPFTKRVETAGQYWTVMDPDRYRAASADPLAQRALFIELARARLEWWLDHAEEALAGTDVRLFITGGNDDEPAVLDVLSERTRSQVVACEGEIVELDDDHTMITVGLSTPTPWNTPREASEGEISALIDESARRVPDPGKCVFNLHCPPKNTPIDTCLLVETEGLEPGELPRPVRRGAHYLTTGGGSKAVGEAIEAYQPLIGLHGHIHESPGRFRIGRTPCLNPGSEYDQGRLDGCIVTLKRGRVTAYQHTSG